MSFPVEMRSAPSMTNTSFDDAGTGSYHGAFQSITTYRYVQEMRDASGNLYGQTINTADAEL
jgi:hypothetical protein